MAFFWEGGGRGREKRKENKRWKKKEGDDAYLKKTKLKGIPHFSHRINIKLTRIFM